MRAKFISSDFVLISPFIFLNKISLRIFPITGPLLKPNFNKFPCLTLAQEALNAGGTAPCLLNAANEEAVHAFLDNRIRLDQIPEIIEFVMNKMPINAVEEIESILEADNVARTTTKERIERKSETHD